MFPNGYKEKIASLKEETMTLVSLETSNERETRDFAIKCAAEASPHDIFLLSGPLGAGKSVFARAFIQSLVGEKIDVPSPTFTLVQTYSTDKAEIWHFDLYRLETPEEIYELGWEEAMGQNILLIEWPERLAHLKPQSYKEIIITPMQEQIREITLRTVKEG